MEQERLGIPTPRLATDDQILHGLIDAQGEIRRLYRQNEILQAKVDTMDLFACVLMSTPAGQSKGFGEDVAWRLEELVKGMKLRMATDV